MAESFCLSAASNAVGTLMVDYLVKPTERGLRYFFRFHIIVQKLYQQGDTLSIEHTQLYHKVEEAKLHIQTQLIEEYVEEWLRNAGNALNDVQSLKLRVEENKRCFHWCPNWIWRYRLSKEIEMKTLGITNLLEKSKFIEIVGHCAELPGLEFVTSKDPVDSTSSTAAFNKIMEALKDDKVKMMGVWGMRGVGKTTLVTKVGKRAKKLQLFHKVVIIVVSQTPHIENIQYKLANFLNLEFKKMTPEGKAEELCLRLQNEKKLLVILDDMWKKLNLEKIGIRLNESGGGTKIILTTHRRTVCESMECQVTVPLDVLDEEAAWTLFKMNAGLDKARSNVIEEAKKVAKECKGLPVAIVTLARALKGTEVVTGWEVARKKLESSRLLEIGNVEDDQEEEKNAYTYLKISYDYLKKETTKRCSLLCALYPEDHSIDVEDLVRYAWGLELYIEATSIEEVRFEVFDTIKYLKDSCLLLRDGRKYGDEERYIKMHDMVRDVALWITSKEESGFMIKSSLGLLNGSHEPCTAIALLDNEKKEFPKGLVCPKLEILLLNNCDISAACFHGMPNLKVLSLADESPYDHKRLFSLNALTSLKRLRALHVENFNLVQDSSSLGNLTTLEILSLRHLEIQELSDNIGNLKKLKVLDLICCNVLSRFPPNLIRSFYQLQELYLYPSRIKMFEETIGEKSSCILLELNFLTKLKVLSLKIDSCHFPIDFKFLRIERYKIVINTLMVSNKRVPDRIASLEISNVFPLNVVSELLWTTESLGVYEIMDEYVECMTDRTREKVPASLILQNLKELRIEGCRNLKKVFQISKVEETDIPLLSRLRLLDLYDLSNLSCIWELPTQHVSLESLVKLSLRNCPSLKSLFSISLAQSLVLLQHLIIDQCHSLKQIVTVFEDVEKLPRVKFHTSLCFPKLTSLNITNCDGLEYIFPTSMAPHRLPQLENLTVRNCPQLADVNALLDPVLAEVQGVRLSAFKGSFCNTKTLTLDETTDHKNLVPCALLEGLTCLNLRNFKDLEFLIDTTQGHVPTSGTFSNLEKLSIKGMTTFKTFCHGQPPKGFLQNLKMLTVEHCANLESIFTELESDNDHRIESNVLCFPNLKTLDIVECPRLEYVFPLALARGLPSLQNVRLDNLRSLSSFISGNNFIEVQALENLHVIQCLTNFTAQIEINKCVSLKKLHIRFGKHVGDAESSPNLPSDLEYITVGNFEQLFLLQGGNLISSVEEMMLENLIWLRDIWKGAIHIASNLRNLEIRKCNRLTYIFPVMLIRKLPQLSYLDISDCQNLEHIIASDDNLPSSSQGHDRQETSVANSGKEMLMFPQLKELALEYLANMKSFSPMSYHSVFPSLDSLMIYKCPQMVTSFTVDSTLTVHAKLEEKDTRLEGSSATFWYRSHPTSLPIYKEEPEISSLK